METWPQRSRGFMGGVLQGSWGLGFLLSFAIYGLFYNSIGWRGMLIVGVLPALAVVYTTNHANHRDPRRISATLPASRRFGWRFRPSVAYGEQLATNP